MKKNSTNSQKNSSHLADLEALLVELDTPTLLELEKSLANILASRSQDSGSGFVYDAIREKMRKRFSFDQVESLRPWIALPKTKRQQFHTAWCKINRDFERIGVTSSPNLTSLLVDLVCKSELFDNHLTFATILESVTHLTELFETSFPGFMSLEGIRLVQNRLSPPNDRTTTSKSST